jgi:hypothetical protein
VGVGTPVVDRPRTLRDAYAAARTAEATAIVDLRPDAVIDLRDDPTPIEATDEVPSGDLAALAVAPAAEVGDWTPPPKGPQHRRPARRNAELIVGVVAIAIGVVLLAQWWFVGRDDTRLVVTEQPAPTTTVPPTTAPPTTEITLPIDGP